MDKKWWRLFAIGLTIFTLGSLLCGLAANPLMIILSRCGQGIGGAIVFATSLALLGHSFRGQDRGTAFGVWGAVTGIAVAAGPVLGGLITTDCGTGAGSSRAVPSCSQEPAPAISVRIGFQV